MSLKVLTQAWPLETSPASYVGRQIQTARLSLPVALPQPTAPSHNGTTRAYGAFSMCSANERLSWAFNMVSKIRKFIYNDHSDTNKYLVLLYSTNGKSSQSYNFNDRLADYSYTNATTRSLHNHPLSTFCFNVYVFRLFAMTMGVV